MNRQVKAFMLSVTMHILVFVPIALISNSIVGANDHVVIDLAMLDTEGCPDAVITGKTLAADRRVVPVRAKPERRQQKVFKEAQTEKTTPTTLAPQPPVTEIHGPVPILHDFGEAVPMPVKQLSRESAGSGIDRPVSSVAGHVVENSNSLGSGVGSGTVNASERGGNPGKLQEQLRQKYVSEHFAYIKKLIQQNLTYPHAAKKAGWAGKVMVSFIILESGRTDSIRILNSSGYSILDNNVIKTIKEVSPFPKPPVKAELHMPIIYQLE